LDTLHANVDDLPELAAEWAELPQEVQVTLSLQWAHLMADYLTELGEHYRSGAMPGKQRGCYVALLEKLRAKRPLVEQLRLYPPPIMDA
jgi:hypothetical protein